MDVLKKIVEERDYWYREMFKRDGHELAQFEAFQKWSVLKKLYSDLERSA